MSSGTWCVLWRWPQMVACYVWRSERRLSDPRVFTVIAVHALSVSGSVRYYLACFNMSSLGDLVTGRALVCDASRTDKRLKNYDDWNIAATTS